MSLDALFDSSNIVLFVKVVDVRDMTKLGLILKNEDGLTAYWFLVKREGTRFDNGSNGTMSPSQATKIQERETLMSGTTLE